MWCVLFRISHVLAAMAERADFTFTFEYESMIRGHHIYKSIWTPIVGETLSLISGDTNEHDVYAVGLVKDDVIVGHAPREVSKIFHFFLRRDGTITANVTGHLQFGHGLEVPCRYTLTGKPKFIKQAKKLSQALGIANS